jgi:hypothetical protein
MVRSILAVIGGYLVMAVLVVLTSVALGTLFPEAFPEPDSGLLPADGWFGLMLGLSFLYAFLGGYVTATIARRAEMRHALALSAIVLALGLLSAVGEQEIAPRWFRVMTPLVGIPGVLLGSRMRALRARTVRSEPGG